MKSIASAPAKIILFGEHFVVHGTPAILAAIDRRVEVTSSFTENETIKVNSQLGTVTYPISFTYEEVKSEFKPFVYLANKMINSNQNVKGLEITIDSHIPIGVGLGSSSACCVAAAASIYGLFKEISHEEILKMSIEAEKTIFPDTSGADCTVCTYGGMIVYDKINGIEKIDNTFEFNFVIVNSEIPHSTRRSVEKVNKFKENNEERFSQLCALETKLIDEVNLALKNKDLTTIGEKMSENQEYLEEIQVSNDTLRKITSMAKKIGKGAKITGAGDGGCVIVLVDEQGLKLMSVISNVPYVDTDKTAEQLEELREEERGKLSFNPFGKETYFARIDTRGVERSKVE